MAEEGKQALECQWCQGLITGRDATKICNNCNTAIHADCWEAYDKSCPTSHCGNPQGWSDGKGMQRVDASPEQAEKGKKCPQCKGAIRDTDVTKICNNCAEVLHTFCWQAGQHLCPTPGCGARTGWADGRGAQKLVKLPDKKDVNVSISSSLSRFFGQLIRGGDAE